MENEHKMWHVRSAVFDTLQLLWQPLVQDMAFPLDGEPKRLYEGCEQADDDAYGDRDLDIVTGHREL